MRSKFLTVIAAACTVAVLAGCDNPISPTRLSKRNAAARPAPTPATLTAIAASSSQIDLAWQDNARNESGWEIHQSPTADGEYGQGAEVGPNVTNYSATGLSAASPHCYKVRSYTTSRKGVVSVGTFSNIACATTQAPPPQPPAPNAPSGLDARPESGDYVRLTWVDNSSDESRFRIEYSYDAGSTWTVHTDLFGPNSTSGYHIPPTEQAVCYRIVAFNDNGLSQPSNVDCTAIPIAPTDFVARGVAGPAVDLTWTDRSGVEDGYELRRAGPDNVSVVIATLGANAASYRDASVTTDTRYTYSLRATRDGGFSGLVSAEAMIAAVAPNAPSDLGAHPFGSTSIGVAWTTRSANHDGFRIERSMDDGVTWLAVGTQDRFNSSFGDPNVATETRACYRVFAVNDAGASAPSNTACATAPAAPTELTIPAWTSTSSDLSWTDNSSVEDGFQIQQMWEDCSYYYGCVQYWIVVATVGANVTTFRHEGLSPGGSYTYRVFALKDGGNSDPSNEITLWIPSGGQ